MPFPAPHSIFLIAHYHQPPGVHPTANTLPAGRECVELVTGGEGALWHDERWVAVGAGDLLWHMPGEQTIGRSRFDDPYRCLAVRLTVPPGGTGRRVPRLSRWDDLDDVRAFTRTAVRYFVDERFDRDALLAYVFGRLLFQARLHHHLAPAPDTPIQLRRALRAIDSGYGQQLLLTDLAALAGCSVPHLHALFRRHFGTSPHQFLIQRRLRAARERLVATDQPVKRIAADCGFADAPGFCRLFRRVVGCSPGEHRRRHAAL